MSINLTNFVKININNHIDTTIKGTRDTALLLSFGTETTATEPIKTTKSNYESQLTGKTEALAFAKVFYDNGGICLDVLTVKNDTDLQTLMESIDTKYVAIAQIGMTRADFETAIANINLNTQDGIYHKIFVGEDTVENLVKTDPQFSFKQIENYVLKIGEANTSASVLAYLTQIDVYEEDSCQDYAFTLEKGLAGTTNNAAVKKCIENNLNIDAVIDGSNVRVVGGNDTLGYSIINQYMLILLHQTLTERLLQVLFSKIKYNDSGIASVLTAMVQELNRYTTNGYIMPNKLWTYDTLYYNDQVVIEKDAILPNGYKVVIMPFSTLTEADLKAHKLPMIYVLVATSYGIRKIEITGEAF